MVIPGINTHAKITHEGYMFFCPIWLNEESHIFPKYKLGLLLDIAIGMQIFFGWIGSFLGIEPMFAMYAKELPEHKQFYIKLGGDQ